MKKLKDLLPALFRTQSIGNVHESAPEIPSVEQSAALPAFGWKNTDQAVHFSNVLALHVPSESLANTAFDDYYPAFYFALRRFEDVRKTGVSEQNENRMPYDKLRGSALPAAQSFSVIDRFYALQGELRASLELSAQGKVLSFDEPRFMQAIFDNIDILSAMKNAMNAPIGNIKEIRSTAMVAMDKPLKSDTVMDRYGRDYAQSYLEEFLGFIEWAEAQSLEHDNSMDSDLTIIGPQ